LGGEPARRGFEQRLSVPPLRRLSTDFQYFGVLQADVCGYSKALGECSSASSGLKEEESERPPALDPKGKLQEQRQAQMLE
jgi:hypothetical protein